MTKVRRFEISKRQRFLVSVVILSFLLFLSEHLFGKSGIYTIFSLALLTDVLLFFATHKDLKGTQTLQVFILPFLYSLSFGLFYFFGSGPVSNKNCYDLFICSWIIFATFEPEHFCCVFYSNNCAFIFSPYSVFYYGPFVLFFPIKRNFFFAYKCLYNTIVNIWLFLSSYFIFYLDTYFG